MAAAPAPWLPRPAAKPPAPGLAAAPPRRGRRLRRTAERGPNKRPGKRPSVLRASVIPVVGWRVSAREYDRHLDLSAPAQHLHRDAVIVTADPQVDAG